VEADSVQIICQGDKIEWKYNFGLDIVRKALERRMKALLVQVYRSLLSEDTMAGIAYCTINYVSLEGGGNSIAVVVGANAYGRNIYNDS
jgi:hypothetical protein